MPNPENVIPHKFKKGQSGNPSGKPRGTRSFKCILRDLLEKKIDINDPFTKRKVKLKAQEVIMLKLVGEAMKGNLGAIRDIVERIDGKVEDTTQEYTVPDWIKDIPFGPIDK